jgi:hypothetical protein
MTTISQLPSDEHVRLTDLIPVVQDGVTKHATVAQILAAGGIKAEEPKGP